LDSASGPHRAPFIITQRTLGHAVLAQGRTDEALQILERALDLSRREFGETDWRTADAQLAYGKALVAAHRPAEAAPLLRAAHVTLREHRVAQPRLAAAAAALGQVSEPGDR